MPFTSPVATAQTRSAVSRTITVSTISRADESTIDSRSVFDYGRGWNFSTHPK